MRLNTGQIVNNRYRIARLLAQGGMGAVYRAWDLTLNIPVALKEMLPDPSLTPAELAELRDQFRKEARILAGLSHPNLPRVTDFFIWNGNDYLVMDFVEGQSLAELIREQGAIPEQQVLLWARQLLDALATCHGRNILHRDIKPQNIIICNDGRAMLVDFGLVKLWDPQKPQTQRIIRGMGTKEYSSPEQFGLSKDAHTEPRSDIYSLGATLYHALTGREPPSALDRVTGNARLLPPQQLGRPVQPRLEAVLMQALALETQERFPDARAMTQALAPESAPKPRRRISDGRERSRSRPVVRPSRAQRPRWVRQVVVSMLMAMGGTLVLQAILYMDSDNINRLFGMAFGTLFLGAVGWFLGDTVFQALTMPRSAVTADRPSSGVKSPTQRLVMSTRRVMQRLTPAQQTGLIVALVVVAAGAAWLLGPVVVQIPWLWYYLPSYAVVAPLVYAAVGRRPGRAGVAHALVAIIGGLALRTSMGTMSHVEELVVGALVSGLVVEGVGYLGKRVSAGNEEFAGGLPYR
jgi:serine/threonine-protein kinase